MPLYRSVSSSAGGVITTSPDETDVAPTGASWTAVPGSDMGDEGSYLITSLRDGVLTTNTSGQIGVRANSGTTNAFHWVTRGFKDFRRV